MRRRLLGLAAATALIAGCGDDGASNEAADALDQGTTAAAETSTALSAEARDILADGEQLADRILGTATEATEGGITEEQAQEQLDSAAKDAEELSQRAQDLPETDAARERLVRLAETSRETADRLRSEAEAGELDASTPEIAELREQAQDTYRALRDQLPAETRTQIEDALESLGSR